jgi:hypothetical protein
VSYASPSEDSGTHASSREEACTLLADDEEVGCVVFEEEADFCCRRAMKPGILSFAEGVGCT